MSESEFVNKTENKTKKDFIKLDFSKNLLDFIDFLNNFEYIENHNKLIEIFNLFIEKQNFEVSFENKKVQYKENIISTYFTQQTISSLKKLIVILNEKIVKTDFDYIDNSEKEINTFKYSLSEIMNNKEIENKDYFKTFNIMLNFKIKNMTNKVLENLRDLYKNKLMDELVFLNKDKEENEEDIEIVKSTLRLFNKDNFDQEHKEHIDTMLIYILNNIINTIENESNIEFQTIFFENLKENFKQFDKTNNVYIHLKNIDKIFNRYKEIKNFQKLSQYGALIAPLKTPIEEFNKRNKNKNIQLDLSNVEYIFKNDPLFYFPLKLHIDNNKFKYSSDDLKLIYLNKLNDKEDMNIKLNYKFRLIQKDYHLKAIKFNYINLLNITKDFYLKNLIEYLLIYSKTPIEDFITLLNNDFNNVQSFNINENELYEFSKINGNYSYFKKLDMEIQNYFFNTHFKNITTNKTLYLNLKRFQKNKTDIVKDFNWDEPAITNTLNKNYELSKMEFDLEFQEKERNENEYLCNNLKIDIETYSDIEYLSKDNIVEMKIESNKFNNFTQNNIDFKLLQNYDNDNNMLFFYILNVLFIHISKNTIFSFNILENDNSNILKINFNNLVDSLISVSNLNNKKIFKTKLNNNFFDDNHLIEIDSSDITDTIILNLKEFVTDTNQKDVNDNNKNIYGEIFLLSKITSNKVYLEKIEEYYTTNNSFNIDIIDNLKKIIEKHNTKNIIYLVHLDEKEIDLDKILSDKNCFGPKHIEKLNNLKQEVYPFIFNYYYIKPFIKNKKDEIIISNLNSVSDKEYSLSPFFGLLNQNNKNQYKDTFFQMFTYNNLKINNDNLYEIYNNHLDKNINKNLKNSIIKMISVYNATRGSCIMKNSTDSEFELNYHIYKYYNLMDSAKYKLEKNSNYSILNYIAFGQKIIDIAKGKLNNE